MLKNFFISMLGAIAGFWISLMLFMVLCIFMIGASIASAVISGAEQQKVELKKETILYIPLDSYIEERASNRTAQNFFNNDPLPQTLENLLLAINTAKEDKNIVGIYLDCQGASAGMATRQALADALADFKASGKWIVAYGDAYDQGDYYVASCADELYLNPVGMVDIRGLASSIPFFKGLLDKVGVEMQIFKVGTYKSAVEPFILDNMSDANREMTQYFLNNLWGEISSTIALNRDVKVETVNQWADSLACFGAPQSLVDLKIVDGLKYRDEVEDLLKEKTGIVKENQDLRMLEYSAYLTVAKPAHTKSNKNKIAVYYACGDITEGANNGIASDRVVPDILDLAEDDDISALVLRVNSGGGSAFASEQIWHTLEVFKSKGKTLYVSMGDYAASGGYYISCGAEKIYAQPTTLTGSIGIFGMIPCAKELFNDKLGVNFGIVQTNPNAAFPLLYQPVTPQQRQAIQGNVSRGYELFTKRCADGRHLPQDSIKAIGEGRVWDGVTAKNIGLVDELGGLDDAIRALADQMNFKDYEIVTYPYREKSFWDIIAEMPTQMKVSALREELGATYPIYLEIKNLQTADPIQARMMPCFVLE